MKSLSPDFIKRLLKKADSDVKMPSVFNPEEHKLIRAAVLNGNGKNEFMLRGRKYVVKRFRHQNEDWVTVRPEVGFVPMFSAPVNWVMDKQKEI